MALKYKIYSLQCFKLFHLKCLKQQKEFQTFKMALLAQKIVSRHVAHCFDHSKLLQPLRVIN